MALLWARRPTEERLKFGAFRWENQELDRPRSDGMLDERHGGSHRQGLSGGAVSGWV
jgi:hypothetical protein